MSRDVEPSSNIQPAETPEYGLEAWEAVSGWFNIPLTPGETDILPQVLSFFSENVVEGEQEEFAWKDYLGNRYSQEMTTAKMAEPREDYMGIPTVGWYVLEYTLPTGEENVHVITTRINQQGYQGDKANGVEIKFVRGAGEDTFQLQKLGKKGHGDNAYTGHLRWYNLKEQMGRTIQEARELSTDGNVSLYYVKNMPPSVSAGGTVLKR